MRIDITLRNVSKHDLEFLQGYLQAIEDNKPKTETVTNA